MNRYVPWLDSECNGIKRVCKLIHGLIALGLIDRHGLADDLGEFVRNLGIDFLAMLGLPWTCWYITDI